MASGQVVKACPLCGAGDVRHERTIRQYELARCRVCGFVYANVGDEIVEAWNTGFNDSFAARYEKMQTPIDQFWFRRIVTRLTNLLGPGKILDVGCGNGVLLTSFIAKGWEAHGVDVSSWAERSAEKYGFTFHPGTVEGSGLPADCFDVVTSTSTLEHIPRPREHVREILRVLKPGGIAYFAGMPNYGSWSIRLNISSFYHNTPPGHANFFTPGAIRHLFGAPEIADCAEKVSVVSYGIPESYRMYQWAKGVVRRVRPERPAERGAAPRRAGKGALRRAALRPLIAAYYHLGRPFGCGDKLEVMVRKRPAPLEADL